MARQGENGASREAEFPAPGPTGPDRAGQLPRLALGAGVALALLLAAIRAVILAPQLAGTGVVQAAAMVAGGVLQDWLVAAALSGLVWAIWLWRGNARLVRAALLGIGSLLLLLALANVRAVTMLDGPVTLDWLAYANLGNSTFMLTSVASELTLPRILAALGLLAAYLGLARLFAAHVDRLHLRRVAPMALAISALLAMTGPSGAPGRVANPVIAFVVSAFSPAPGGATVTTALGGGASLRDKAEFAGLRATALPRPAGDVAAIRNVVIYVMESVGVQVATGYGGDFEMTPNFARLADEMGLRFSDIYAHAPASNYSLVSLIAGIEPDLWSKSMTVGRDDLPIVGLPTLLETRAMRTAYFNSNDKRFQNAGGFAERAGFDLVLDSHEWDCALGGMQYTGTDEPLDKKHDFCTVAEVMKWIDSDPATPFFVTLWTGMAHYPYFAGPNPVSYVENQNQNDYLNAIRVIDEGLGMLVEDLRQRELLDSTLIVVLGDHGEAFGEHGQYGHATGLWEENMHVALAFLNPRLFPGGETARMIGGIPDVPATITDLLGLATPPSWHGQSFFSEGRHQGVFLFSPWGGFRTGFRVGDRKFIFNANTGEALLYDLAADPRERVNLAETDPAALEQSMKDLASWVVWQTAYRSGIAEGTVSANPVAGPVDIIIRASGTSYLSAPRMRLYLDGEVLTSIEVVNALSNAEAVVSDAALRASFSNYPFRANSPSCPKVLEIEFLNDEWAGEGQTGDTDLFVERVTFAGVNYYPNRFRLVTPNAGGQFFGLYRMSRKGLFAVDLALPPVCLAGAVGAL
ncbi:MAG: sulfatase-like hydrolase/transferase [Phaeovulum sp.]|uniref:sulfatase-like hydrolase/transferase n=2 Tax=Phaeovulum sp. TaxID=2934796 RepID=UPI00272F1416|nr:sulfatase-like hydrolase/transferase [Phaeovulum sp.]MDP2062878.1 sulfatase-like hydrolase/transferase [Phaeovulum sp.]